MQWISYQGNIDHALKLIFAIPNGGQRDTGNWMVAEGLKAGVPDLFLPVARGGYHGMFIEMKAVGGKKPRETQEMWIGALRRQGYHVVVAYGWEEASKKLMEYIKL